MTLQERIFDAWVGFMLRHRVLVLLLVATITGALGWRVAQLPVMNALRDMLPVDTAMAQYDAARARFGGDETVLVAVEADDHFTEPGVERLRKLTVALAEHPLTERVVSLMTADWIHPSEGGGLRIEPFADLDPEALRAAALGDDLVRGTLVSPDGRIALVAVQLVPNEDEVYRRAEVRKYVNRHVERIPGGAAQLRHQSGPRRAIEGAKHYVEPEFMRVAGAAGYRARQVHLSGFPVIFGSLLIASQDNIKVLFPVTVVAIGLMLLVLLRRFVDVLLPLVCVLPAVVWAVAIGGEVFGRLTIITSAAPVMVLVVGMSDVVHLVTQFRHELARGRDREEAIHVAFREVGAACTLTSLTTFIGFGSMVLMPLPHSRELGVFAATGVVTAFLLAFVLTPILLSYSRSGGGVVHAPDRLARFLGVVADALRPHARWVLGVGVVATALVTWAALQIEVENSLSRKLPEDHPVRAAVKVVERAVGGSWQLEVIVDSGRDEGLKAGGFVQSLGRLEHAIEALPKVGVVQSLVDVLGRMHRVLAPDHASTLPDTPEMVAQYLLLFEMSGGEDLTALVDPTQRHLRLAVRLADMTAEEGIAIAAEIDRLAKELLPAGTSAYAGGFGLMTARAGPEILRGSLRGLATALVLIALLMGVLFRSVRVGLLSIVPNLLPVAFGLVMASWFVAQVDVDALMNLTICIGIAVDDTIHFLSRYRIERRRGLDRADAVRATIVEAGHGITRTSLILVGGFLVLVLSDVMGLRVAGVMLPAALASAVLLDLTLVPAMAQLGLLEPHE